MRFASLRALPLVVASLAGALAAPAVVAAAGGPPSPRGTFHSVQTPSFRVVGSISPRRVAETAERLEVFRAALGRLKPQAPARTSVPALVLAFSGERELRPYIVLDGRLAKGYSGVFHQSRYANYMVFDALAGEDPLDAVYGGYIHFYIGENYPGTPLWLQVGLAEYYETFRATSSAVEVGRPHQNHAQYLAQGWRIPLAQLVAITRESPAYRDPGQFGIYASHCWALVHYLLVGGEGLAPRVPDLLARLDGGETLDAALQAALGLGAPELESRLRLYTRQPLFPYQIWKTGELDTPEIGAPVELAKPEVLELLGEYLAHSDMPDAARAHLDAALAAEPDNGDALAMQGYLAQEAGKTEDADALYAGALAGRMRRAVSALHAGEFALERASSAGEDTKAAYLETARAAARKARELDPESGEAYALEGRAALESGAGAEALAALTEAQSRLPARVDVVYGRYRAALAANLPTVARGIVVGPLARLDRDRAAQELRFLTQREQSDLANGANEQADRAIDEERYDDALTILRDGVAQATDPGARQFLASRLTYLEGWIAGKRRTELYNHAVGLAGQRKYAEARAEIDQVLTNCPAEGEPVCHAALDMRGQLDRLLKGR